MANLINDSLKKATLTIANLPTGGSIGTAADTVDICSSFAINQTTLGQTITIPSPTDTTAGDNIDIINIGTAPFTMSGKVVEAGSLAGAVWTGTVWNYSFVTPAGIDKQIQFNDGGAFGADGGLTYDKATNEITVRKTDTGNGVGTTNGKISIEQQSAVGTSKYSTYVDDYDLLTTTRAGDTTGDGAIWVLHNYVSPNASSPTLDSEATISLTTRANPTNLRALDLYNNEYSRDRGMGMRQLYKGTQPTPFRFEFHDKTVDNGSFSFTDCYTVGGSTTFNYVTLNGLLVPQKDDLMWDNSLLYIDEGTRIVSIDTVTKTIIMSKPALATGSGFSAVGRNIKEIMRLSPDRQLLVRKFTASDTNNVAEFGGKIQIDGAIGVSGNSFGVSGQVLTSTGNTTAPIWQTPSEGSKIVKYASTANVNIATGLINGTAFGGGTLATGDLILLKDQTTQTENGVYVVPATGAATRDSSMATGSDAFGKVIDVRAGNSAGVSYKEVNSPAIVGTNNLSFVSIGQGVLAEYGSNTNITNNSTVPNATFIDVPNSTFTLPSAGIWEVEYVASVSNSAANGTSQTKLVTSANVDVPNSYGAFQSATANARGLTTQTVTITTTGAETFKMRFASAGANTTTIWNNTTNQGQSNITWKKIAGVVPVTGQTVDYAEIRQTTNGTSAALVANSPVPFDTLVSGNISYTNPNITLLAGKTYELEASVLLQIFTDAGGTTPDTDGGDVEFVFYNVTAGTQLGTAKSAYISPTTLTSFGGQQGVLKTIFTPTVNTQVQVRLSALNGTASARLYNTGTYLGSSYFTVKQIGSSAITTTTRVNVICRNKTAQSLPTTAWTGLTNWTEIQDPTNSMNAATGIFTSPRATTYAFTAGNGVPITAAGQYFGISVWKNGAQLYNSLTTSGSGTQQYPVVSGVVEMATGDTLQVRSYNGAPTANDVVSASNSWFTVTEINPTF
jgi:hypothetical protein